ncbi:MarR family winged helix-turn-helix transcriptional regulator [Nocardia macrotermitis]|uniref:Transcriptional regulator HosA n=1 Tax=Nocardia macrotermitis TaxID=2585198 RepID=A0A7K0D3Z0_9NOCA|nr:MarR family winged helix-turn-helix transcriptional regulator [Nocardia macrotermitis]MQY20321.1 Transcriptional regulator HosA [Nocardia macrotermitis]
MFDDTPFHLMRVILQDHGARWYDRMPHLTKPQYAVLEALDAHDGLDQKALGEASATTKATLTEMLTRMQERGLIERRADAADGRKRSVHLTATGRRTLTEARIVARDLEKEILGTLTPDQLRQLSSLLATLRHATS